MGVSAMTALTPLSGSSDRLDLCAPLPCARTFGVAHGRGDGFTLVELILSTALLVLLLTFMIPLLTQWQRYARRELACSFAQWDRDFLAQRFYSQAMVASQVQVDGSELKMTGASVTLRYGVSNRQCYEFNQVKKYLTYAPVQVKNFSLQTQGALVRATWDTCVGDECQEGRVYVP